MVGSSRGILNLESLAEKPMPACSPDRARALEEACVWCLLSHDHKTETRLAFSDSAETAEYQVTWQGHASLAELSRVYNQDDGPEDGATAIALLLVREHTPYTAVERSARGTGVDYWLDYDTGSSAHLFTDRRARLEVSGIYEENQGNSVRDRLSRKIRQAQLSGVDTPLYVVVVEFGSPRAEMVRRHERASNAA